jgi:hypothetical protein
MSMCKVTRLCAAYHAMQPGPPFSGPGDWGGGAKGGRSQSCDATR